MESTDIFYRTLVRQGEAILNYAESFRDETIQKAVNVLYYGSTGRTLLVTGVGKSGNIAAKIASTLTSTGTPAFYLCPLEALHGGLGAVRWGDVLIVLSKSGETQEILDMLPYLKEQNVTIVSITCSDTSTLANASSVVIKYNAEECCGTGFIPTTSTTTALSIGDALAMSLMFKDEFTIERFARFHPGGSLGKTVRDSLGQVEFPHEKG
jgi:arabinose-5-phosphate isomerase